MRHTFREELEGKNIYTVYLIRCKINHKGYVGQTTQKNLAVRFNGGWGYKGNSKFFADIQKYGWKNFEHKVYATNLSSEEADKLEQEIIKQYNLTDSRYGYNRLTGGKEAGTIKFGDEYLKDSPKRGSWGKVGNFIDPEGNLHENVNRAYVGRRHKDWVRIKSAEELEEEARKKAWHTKVEENKTKKAEYIKQREARKAEKLRRKVEQELKENEATINAARLDSILADLGYRLTVKLKPSFIKVILQDIKYIHSVADHKTARIRREDLSRISVRSCRIFLYTGILLNKSGKYYLNSTTGVHHKVSVFVTEYCSKILERI